MAWIEVHQSLWDHRKTLAVADALDLRELYAASHLIALWTWAIDNAPDGAFGVTVTSRIIARGARWTGSPDVFVQALLDAGFLEYGQDGRLYVHDWEQYGGKLNAQRKANAERQQRHRERERAKADVTSQDERNAPSQSVTVTSPLRNAPENSTEENSTEEIVGDTPTPPARTRTKPTKATAKQIPDDFTLTDDRMAYAAEHGMSEREARLEFETLRNWAESNGTKKLSWEATWKQWVLRREKERAAPRASPAPSQRNGYRGKDIGLSNDELMAIARGERP